MNWVMCDIQLESAIAAAECIHYYGEMLMGNEEANSGILYKLGEAIDVSILRIRLDGWMIE